MASDATTAKQTEPSTPASEPKSNWRLRIKHKGKVVWSPEKTLEENRAAFKKHLVAHVKPEE